MQTRQRLQFSRRLGTLIKRRQEARTEAERNAAGEHILHMLRLLSVSKSKHPYTL